MRSKWILFVLLFSVTVNVAVVGTLIYFWRYKSPAVSRVHVEHKRDVNDRLLWFHSPDLAPRTIEKIDSARKVYHEELQQVRKDIDSQRKNMVTLLLAEPINRDSLQIEIIGLVEKQKKAEELTLDHLLDIKPLLPKDQWILLLKDLEPRRMIRTKIIRVGGQDTANIVIENEDIDEIRLFEPGLRPHGSRDNIKKRKH